MVAALATVFCLGRIFSVKRELMGWRVMLAWLLASLVIAQQFRPIIALLSGGDRPSWSVCGQDLCLCQPVPMDPDCPLCLAGNAGGEGCSGVGADLTRVPWQDPTPDDPMAAPARAGEGVLFALLILFSGRDGSSAVLRAGIPVRCDAMHLPPSPDIDTPTPPPRA